MYFFRKMIVAMLVLSLAVCILGRKTQRQETSAAAPNVCQAYRVSGAHLSLETEIKDSPEYIDEITAIPHKICGSIAKKVFLENARKAQYDNTADDGEYYEDKNGSHISVIRNEGVNYFSSFYWHVMNCFRADPRDARYNGDQFSKTKEFSFMSREEALNVLTNQLHHLGIELGDIEYTCYSLDYQTLEKEEYAEDINGREDTSGYKKQWTSKDNCYFFAIRQKYQDIVEYHKFAGIYKNYEDWNSSILALVSERGLESLEMSCALQFQKTGTRLKIKTPQQILDCISEKYGNGTDGKTYTITSFNLCYMTDILNGYKITPIYQCHMIEENGEEKRVEQVLINAVTGEEIQ